MNTNRVINYPKHKTFLLIFIALFLAVASYFAVPGKAAPTPPNVYLTPSSQLLPANTNFTVQVREISGSTEVNAVEANFSYNASLVDFVSFDATGTSFGTNAAESGGSGQISVARGVSCSSTCPPVTGDQLVVRVNFKTKATSGTLNMAFTSGTQLIDANTSTDILGSLSNTTGATYKISTVPLVQKDNPFGSVDKLRRYPGGLRADGWAMDPSTTASINVDIYSGDGAAKPGQYEGSVLADDLRNDLSVIGNGSNHGFTKAFLLEDNVNHNVCFYGINIGDGANRQFTCSQRTLSGDTIGKFEFLYRVPGGVALKGWSFDPDTDLPINVQFFASDVADPARIAGGTLADKNRQDVVTNLASTHVGYSATHGFERSLPSGPGLQHLCAFAINSSVTPGASSRIGCGDIFVSNQPKGYFESAVRAGGNVTVSGWALDPDVFGPIDIHIYVNGNFFSGFKADNSRLDIVPSNPGYGALHGFSKVLTVGVATFCAYALNASGTPGGAVSLGCKAV